jgi:murein DD-endopeptidase MepM/ murein hydrolase activator NlpD
MGKISSRRHLRAAAAVSLAVLAASCGGGRNDAAPVIMNGAAANGAGPDRIETAPIAPLAGMPLAPRPISPRASASRPPTPSGPGTRIVVRPGMSVRYLALLYGVPRQAIIDANHLTPPDYKIEIGQALVVPGAAGERGPLHAASAEKPAPERPAASHRAAKAGEVIPLDDPAPAPRKTAEAQASSLSPPAAAIQGNRPEGHRAQGKLSPPAAEPAEDDEAAEAGPPAKSGAHFPWPVRGRVLAGYGATKEGGHNAGINIAAARGAPVRAVEGGVVAYAGNEIRGYGNLVLVKHPDGFISAYAHLDSLLVKRGDTVTRGQVIAKVGTTGGVSEPQLHFELRRGKNAVDPRQFLAPGANAGGGGSGDRG